MTTSPTVKRKVAIVAMVAVCAGLGSAFLWRGNAVVPASTFVLLDATKRTASDLKGKVTLVNFWATSCVTRVAEMPDLIEKLLGGA